MLAVKSGFILFIKSDQFPLPINTLERERGFNRKKLEKACTRLFRLQAVYRGFSQEKKYKQARAGLIRLQTVYRGFSQRQKYKQARARLISLTAIV